MCHRFTATHHSLTILMFSWFLFLKQNETHSLPTKAFISHSSHHSRSSACFQKLRCSVFRQFQATVHQSLMPVLRCCLTCFVSSSPCEICVILLIFTTTEKAQYVPKVKFRIAPISKIISCIIVATVQHTESLGQCCKERLNSNIGTCRHKLNKLFEVDFEEGGRCKRWQIPKIILHQRHKRNAT